MRRPTPSPKVVLIADRRTEALEPAPAVLRRYRLARLRFETGTGGRDDRFEHLKRVYD